MEAFANSDHKFPSFPFPNVGPRHVDAASNRKSATKKEVRIEPPTPLPYSRERIKKQEKLERMP